MALFNNITFLKRNFGTIFLILIAGLLITGGLTQKDDYLTKTPDLPLGIISWEINADPVVQKDVLTTWERNRDNLVTVNESLTQYQSPNGLTTALAQNEADYGFIVFYVAILLVCFIRLSVYKPNHRPLFSQRELSAWIIAIVLAGVLDMLEDLGTAKIIEAYQANHQLLSPLYICIPGIIKWLLIIGIIGRLVAAIIKLDKPRVWLQDFSNWLNDVIIYGWRFRLVLITLVLFILVLFVSDQGQDLLITINGNRFACGLFIMSTTLLAMLCWYLPKAIDNAKQLSYRKFWLGPVDYVQDGNKRPKDKLDIGRLLGATAFLVPAVGILHVMQVYKIAYWLDPISPMAILVIILFFYAITLKHNWIEAIFKDPVTWGIRVKLYTLVMALCAAFIVWKGFDHNNTNPYFLSVLCVDLVVLSAMFLITTTLRTCISPPQIAQTDKKEKPKWIKNAANAIQQLAIAPFITFGAVIGFVFFVICNFPFLSTFTDTVRFLTMPMVFFAVAGYLLFSAFLLFIGKRTGITVLTFIFVFAFYRAEHTVSPYHNIAMLTNDHSRDSAESLSSYAKNWLLNRRDEMVAFNNEHHQAYPVFFVNAYGGGIRATVWTTMVIGTLDSVALDRQRSAANPKDFRHYVFSMSGASGGTIGLALLSATRAHYMQKASPTVTSFKNDNICYPGQFCKLYGHDYLTADIAALLGRDMLASSLGLSSPWKDRARLMEEDWEHQLKHIDNISFDAPLHSLWKKGRYELPLFFSNTYDVDMGMKGTLSPVLMNHLDFPHTLFPEQEMLTPTNTLRLSSAAFLSARFPYVSPTGNLNALNKLRSHHFTDGGTWENSGAQTSHEVQQVFMEQLALLTQHDDAFKNIKIKIAFLSLPNSYQETPPIAAAKNLFEPVAPVKGLLSLIGAHELKADTINYAYAIKNQYNFFTIRPVRRTKEAKQNISPVLPLGWQISDAAMVAMSESITKIDTARVNAVLSLMAAGNQPKKP